jgi:2-methylisoborneol synthase
MSMPAARDGVADVVAALFSNPARLAPLEFANRGDDLVPEEASPDPSSWVERLFCGPTGLGTSAARLASGFAPVVEVEPEPALPPDDEDQGMELYCPPAVRDNVALGEAVNDSLVEWAEEVGIYPGQLDRVRSANFGRLIMLTHPGTDDPDRLLAAAKCILAEWATDDHFLDEESLGADPAVIGSRLGVAYASIDPVHLSLEYAWQLDQALADEPVSVAYRSAFEHLARYATGSQVARLHHELSVMFLAYSHEASWRTEKRVPSVWEYLTHRWENSFLPPMVLVDPVAGYEIPPHEFADRTVRRLFGTAGLASVILNDLYSMSTESDEDFDLPKVIVAEVGCSHREAITRSVKIHNELMHRYEEEAAVVSNFGSPGLRRFLADLWAWLGGNREWHSTTRRYQTGASD